MPAVFSSVRVLDHVSLRGSSQSITRAFTFRPNTRVRPSWFQGSARLAYCGDANLQMNDYLL